MSFKNLHQQFTTALPFIFAELIFAFVYFVFIVRWIPVLFSLQAHAAIIEAVLFHVLLGLCQASYIKTTITDPGRIPEGYNEQDSEDPVPVEPESEPAADADAEGLIVKTEVPQQEQDKEKRKCKKCIKMKPDRAHHCSQCKRCVLKMDHHCPWVNNCVGFFNYKYFVLFLTYTYVLGAYVVLCLLDPCFSIAFYDKHRSRDPFIFVVFIIGSVFGVGLALFAITHYVYIGMNQTTIEVMEKKGKRGNAYNLGWRRNFNEIFGDNPLLWFIPVNTTKGDGLTFPTNLSTSIYV